jgi:hypothetical protein
LKKKKFVTKYVLYKTDFAARPDFFLRWFFCSTSSNCLLRQSTFWLWACMWKINNLQLIDYFYLFSAADICKVDERSQIGITATGWACRKYAR